MKGSLDRKSLGRTEQDIRGGECLLNHLNRILLKAGEGLRYQGCRMRNLIGHEGWGGSP